MKTNLVRVLPPLFIDGRHVVKYVVEEQRLAGDQVVMSQSFRTIEDANAIYNRLQSELNNQ
jgi:hypothetical protein